MTQNSVPWGKPGDTDPTLWQYEDRYRAGSRAWGNGVINDRGDHPFRATCTGSDQVLRVAAGEYFFNGTHGIIPAQNFTLSAYGTSPSSGQARIDALVLRYDPDVQDVVLVLKPGTPAPGTVTSGPVPPPITSDPDGIEEDLILYVARQAGEALLQENITPIAPRLGGVTTGLHGANARTAGSMHVTTQLPWVSEDHYPMLGVSVLTPNAVTGALSWLSINDPRWVTSQGPQTWQPQTGMASNGFGVRLVGGRMEFLGSIAPTAGTDIPGADTTVVTIASLLAWRCTSRVRGHIATNTVYGARATLTPRGDGAALLQVAAPPGSKVAIFDGLSLPIL